MPGFPTRLRLGIRRRRPEYAVGIDFGTSKTAVRFMDMNRGVSDWINLGIRQIWKMPSLVAVEPVIGKPGVLGTTIGRELEGKKFGVIRDEDAKVDQGIFAQVKLHLGQRGFDEERYSEDLLNRFPELRTHPEYLAACLLRHARYLTGLQLRQRIDSATITVPASWDPEQRRATKFAALLAGFRDVELLDEPVAALIWILAQPSPQVQPGPRDSHVMVVDFGGGTCDIAVVKVADGEYFQLEGVVANERLGGEMIDDLLFKEFEDFVFDRKGLLLEPPMNRSLARGQIEDFKQEINRRIVENWPVTGYKQPIEIGGDVGQVNWELSLAKFKRLLLEEPSEQCVEAGKEACSAVQAFRKLIESARIYVPGHDLSQISKVYLVGGSSHLFFVKPEVLAVFGRKDDDFAQQPDLPDRIVSAGAALHQYRRLCGKRTFTSMLPYSIAIRITEDELETMVEQNEPLSDDGIWEEVTPLLVKEDVPSDEPLVLQITPSGTNVKKRKISKEVEHTCPVTTKDRLAIEARVAVDGVVSFRVKALNAKVRFSVKEDYPVCPREGFDQRAKDFREIFPLKPK